MESKADIGRERILILGLLLTQPSAMNPIVEFLTAATFITGIIVYVARLAINKGFDVALKNHQNRLDLLKKEHEVRFSSLHSERAKVIKATYSRLSEIQLLLNQYFAIAITPPISEEEPKEFYELKDEIEDTRILIDRNSIYFTIDVSDSIIDLLHIGLDCLQVISELRKKYKEYGHGEYWDRLEINTESEEPQINKKEFLKKELDKTQAKLWEVTDIFKSNRSRLAEKFRSILGVEIDD